MSVESLGLPSSGGVFDNITSVAMLTVTATSRRHPIERLTNGSSVASGRECASVA